MEDTDEANSSFTDEELAQVTRTLIKLRKCEKNKAIGVSLSDLKKVNATVNQLVEECCVIALASEKHKHVAKLKQSSKNRKKRHQKHTESSEYSCTGCYIRRKHFECSDRHPICIKMCNFTC